MLENVTNKVNGWSFWKWKRVPDKYPCLTGIQLTTTLIKLIKWINNNASPKPTVIEAKRGMDEFIEAIEYPNVIKNDTLRNILQVCKP